MANTKQAKKRARQAECHRQHNQALRTKLRTYIKNVVKAIQGGKKDLAVAAYKIAEPIIDRMASKRIITKNKAARHKHRLSAHIKKIAA